MERIGIISVLSSNGEETRQTSPLQTHEIQLYIRTTANISPPPDFRHCLKGKVSDGSVVTITCDDCSNCGEDEEIG